MYSSPDPDPTPKAQSRLSVINKRCSGRLFGGLRRLWCHIFRISLTFFKLVFWVIGTPVNSSTPQRETKRIGPSFINFCRLQCSCIFGSGRQLLVMFMLPGYVRRWCRGCHLWFCGWERLGRAASIGIDRLGRKHKVEWVAAKSSIFYNSTLRYAGRTSSHAHPKENAYNTLGYRFFYLYRNFTVNAR